jgi:hypothetical protein
VTAGPCVSALKIVKANRKDQAGKLEKAEKEKKDHGYVKRPLKGNPLSEVGYVKITEEYLEKLGVKRKPGTHKSRVPYIRPGFILYLKEKSNELGSAEVSAAASMQEAAESAAWVNAQQNNTKKPGGQGFNVDQKAKQKVEECAMEAAIDHYSSHKWIVDPEAYKSNPFDLICRRNGEVKHVEVKGTTGDPSEIFLTRNEVDHARECTAEEKCQTVALYILSGIDLEKDGTGAWKADGGEPTIYDPWKVDDGILTPICYRYQTPDPAAAPVPSN